MEEADLRRERLQAIAEKRKLQVDIANKRREIEEEKLKFQYLKKKALKEQWLLEGQSTRSPQERSATMDQAWFLQNNIHRMEKEVETLEREEMVISMNESFILKRLKAIEKSPDDVIKELKADLQKGTFLLYTDKDIPLTSSVGQCVHPNSSAGLTKCRKPSSLRKSSTLVQAEVDKLTPALFAMEINVQKDAQTGERHVLSTKPAHLEEAQKSGVKVYDDGRKSVYALHSNSRIGNNAVDELSTQEVEALLRDAKWKSSNSSQGETQASAVQGCSKPLRMEGGPKKLVQSNGVQELCRRRSYERCQSARDASNYRQAEQSNNGTKGFTKDQDQEGVFYNHSKHNHQPEWFTPLPKSQNWLPMYSETPPGAAGPFNMESSKPVTMIFMGYQTADDANASEFGLEFDGAIRAELVIISEDDDDGCYGHIYKPLMGNGNNSLPTTSSIHCQETESMLNRAPRRTMVDGTPNGGAEEKQSRATGTQKTKRRMRHRCCSLM